MMKSTISSFAAALTAFAMVFSVDGGTVFRPGLLQGRYNLNTSTTSASGKKWNTVGLDESNVEVLNVAGPGMANIRADESTAGTKPWIEPFHGKEYFWNAQATTFSYHGYIYQRAGESLTFGKLFDDSALIKVDGVQILSNGSWNQFASATVAAPAVSTWRMFEVRLADGTGGKGPSTIDSGAAVDPGFTWNNSSKPMGLAYNTEGHTRASPISAWQYIVDTGDMSFLRCQALNEESFVKCGDTVRSGDNYKVSITCTDLPANATLRVVYASEDRGFEMRDWDGYYDAGMIAAGSSSRVASIPAAEIKGEVFRLVVFSHSTFTPGTSFEDWSGIYREKPYMVVRSEVETPDMSPAVGEVIDGYDIGDEIVCTAGSPMALGSALLRPVAYTLESATDIAGPWQMIRDREDIPESGVVRVKIDEGFIKRLTWHWASSGGGVFVDSKSTTEFPDGSAARPFPTISAAMAVAFDGAVIYVRGGADRAYVYSVPEDAGTVSVPRVTISGYGLGGVATSATDDENMALVTVTEGYAAAVAAAQTAAHKAVADGVSPLRFAGEGCTVTGLRFVFGAASLAAEGFFAGAVIETTKSGLTVRNCRFEQSSAAAGASGVRGAIWNRGVASEGLKVTDSVFAGGSDDGFVCAVYGARGELELVGNVFTNVNSLQAGAASSRLAFISNTVINCSATHTAAGYLDAFISQAGEGQPVDAEIAYNLFIRDGGVAGSRYAAIAHGGAAGGSMTGDDVTIHHNTAVGLDAFLVSRRFYRDGSVQLPDDLWCPKVFDNLVVSANGVTTDFFHELGKDDGATYEFWYGNACTSYRPGSLFSGNACYGTVIGGPMRANFSSYDILPNLTVLSPNFELTEAPSFVTTDITLYDRYRVRVRDCPWSIQGWTGEDPAIPRYPGYVGAVRPRDMTGTAVRLR